MSSEGSAEFFQEEHRAMALPQLRRVVSHAARRCAEEGWTRFGEAGGLGGSRGGGRGIRANMNIRMYIYIYSWYIYTI